MAFKRSGVRFPSPPLGRRFLHAEFGYCVASGRRAGIAQLVEHNLAKVGVAGSSPVSRSVVTDRPGDAGPSCCGDLMENGDGRRWVPSPVPSGAVSSVG